MLKAPFFVRCGEYKLDNITPEAATTNLVTQRIEEHIRE